MDCPLKRLGAAFLAAGDSRSARLSAVTGTVNNACDAQCAWYVDGKCAIAVMAAKQP